MIQGTDLKRIAIFCDGTWNRADAKHATNVVMLSQALSFIAEDGTFQQMSYIQGVGTGRGTGKVSRFVDRLGGGAFGWGLTENIEEAYRGLAFSYQPGDEIYIFGFSRGAYTARSLAGLIRSSGIPPRSRVDKIPEAIKRYRSRNKSTHPNDPESFRFRCEINDDIVTSAEEAEWRRANGLKQGTLLQIAYLGVWDTVGALGLPGHFGLLAKLFNQKYNFHDAALSRSVRAARHAVAIDERRRTFLPTLWGNLDALNGDVTGDERPYRQIWFPGDHGSVGGGGDITGLSDDALVWIAQGAQALGLQFENELLDWHKSQRDYLAPLHNQSDPKTGFFKKLTSFSKKDRDGPTLAARVSQAARDRWNDPGAAYRPQTLDKVSADINKA